MISRKVTTARKIIRSHNLKFDAIAFTGNSGALVAAPLAIALDKKLILIRKRKDMSHGEFIEGNTNSRYIILDDFIASGCTMSAIIRALRYATGRCVGIVLYKHHRSFAYYTTYATYAAIIKKKKGYWTYKGIRIYNRVIS
jgi:adenine/guanine phosphoribosyltransferase-like PRPP-binding protein